jgi:hypothetical protein
MKRGGDIIDFTSGSSIQQTLPTEVNWNFHVRFNFWIDEVKIRVTASGNRFLVTFEG